MTLRRIDATRPPGRLRRAYSWFGGTRAARFVSRHVSWKLDPLLLRVTGGRVSSTLMVPSAVLETRGARTGATRRHVVIYFHDGDRVIVVASNAGNPKDPAWFHNVRANPDVVIGGLPMTGRPVEDQAERDRLWRLADNVFPAFARFRAEAAGSGRTIPLVALVPRHS